MGTNSEGLDGNINPLKLRTAVLTCWSNHPCSMQGLFYSLVNGHLEIHQRIEEKGKKVNWRGNETELVSELEHWANCANGL